MPTKKRNTNSALRTKLDAAWVASQGNTINQDPLWELVTQLTADIAKSTFYRGDYSDAVQEATMEVLQSLPTFNSSKSRFSTWVWNIAVRRYSKTLRERQNPLAEAVNLDELPASEYKKLVVNPGTKIEHQEANAGIQQALKRLSPEQRKLIKQHLAGSSFRDIGKALGISKDEANYRWRQALQELEDAQDV